MGDSFPLTHAPQVTMVFPESRLMERLFTPELAAFYEGFYTSEYLIEIARLNRL